MFKSFFPKPGPFFLSAFIWALIAVIFWQAGGGAWLTRITGATGEVPISAARFWSLSYLLFYAYYMVCVGLFALFWFVYSPHRWQYWSILGTSLIIFVTWFLVEVGVAVNAWYAPFYDLIQTALSSPHKVTINQFYHEVGVFLGIALIAVIIGVMNNFFVSHYVFRWRTAMNEHYMAHWQHLRHIEGAAQRVQEDTMRFASTLEDMGGQLYQRHHDADCLPAGAGDALGARAGSADCRPHSVWSGDCRDCLVADGHGPAGGSWD